MILNQRETSKHTRARGLYRTCLAAALAGPAVAQQAPLSLNENVVFIDPAHGGTDPGAHLGGSVEEKDVTLAIAGKLRTVLAVKGFSVVLTRDGDASVSAEQRANLANHARPLVCVLVHASLSGPPASLAVSTVSADAEQRSVIPWATAQGLYVSESLAFREAVAAALTAASVKSVPLRASVPPIDSLTCAAVVVEFAGPHLAEDGYQQRMSDAMAQSIVAWKAEIAPPKAAPPAPPTTGPAGGPVAPGAQP